MYIICEPTGRKYIGQTECSCTDFSDHERLDLAGVRDVGADAEIDHGPAAVHGGGGAVGDLRLDDLDLVFVVLLPSASVRGTSKNVAEVYTNRKHLEECLLGHDDALEFLFLLDGQLGDLFERRVVRVGDGSAMPSTTRMAGHCKGPTCPR